uniref:aldose epimerase family protein n=1 Tax=Arsukibacterium sp. TaxID=1977258 RepID=UPI002FD8DD84
HNQQAIRGGVPVCWPWFGPPASRLNPASQALPNHGLVRNRLWQVLSTEVTPAAVSIALFIDVKNLPYSPGTVRLQLHLRLTHAQLQLSLTCDSDLPQQAALHSYFRVTDITQARVKPLPELFFDKVSGIEQRSNDDILRISAETDRVYHQPANCIQLQCLAQQLTISHSGQDSAIVWNPWQQKSRELPDMADHGYREFICIESARLNLECRAPLKLTLCIAKA